MEEKNKIKRIIIGSSKSDNKKRFEEMHPEMKRAMNSLSEANKGNTPIIGSKDSEDSKDSCVVYKKRSK